MANATEIVGALHQDRHSGIMGVLGEEAPMVPVTVKVRSLGDGNAITSRREGPALQRLPAPEMDAVPDDDDAVTTRSPAMNEFDGRGDLPAERQGGAGRASTSLDLNTMQASGEAPMPAPMVLAGWWGDKFNRLFSNAVKTPQLKGVDVTVDLLPERRVATIENAWVAVDRSAARRRSAGEGVPAALSRRAHRARFHDAASRRASPKASTAFC